MKTDSSKTEDASMEQPAKLDIASLVKGIRPRDEIDGVIRVGEAIDAGLEPRLIDWATQHLDDDDQCETVESLIGALRSARSSIWSDGWTGMGALGVLVAASVKTKEICPPQEVAFDLLSSYVRGPHSSFPGFASASEFNALSGIQLRGMLRGDSLKLPASRSIGKDLVQVGDFLLVPLIMPFIVKKPRRYSRLPWWDYSYEWEPDRGRIQRALGRKGCRLINIRAGALSEVTSDLLNYCPWLALEQVFREPIRLARKQKITGHIEVGASRVNLQLRSSNRQWNHSFPRPWEPFGDISWRWICFCMHRKIQMSE